MLAEKCYHNSVNIFVYTDSREYTLELDRILWTYSKKQFIPHGTINDPHPEKQPILIGSAPLNIDKTYDGIMLVNTDVDKILLLLGNDKAVNVNTVKRFFFLYDQEFNISDTDLRDIFTKSAFSDFNFESYVQSEKGGWQKSG